MKAPFNVKEKAQDFSSNILARLTSIMGTVPRPGIGGSLAPTDSLYKTVIPRFLFKPPFGFPRFVDVPEIRRLAASPFVEMAIRTIIDEIAQVDWAIVPKDAENKSPQTKKNSELVKEFFDNPNVNKENFNSQIRAILYDILVLDSGVWNKVFDQEKHMAEMYVRDGGTFTKNPDMFGTFSGKLGVIPPPWVQDFADPNTSAQTIFEISKEAAYYQYGWITGARPMPLGTREIVYIMRNPRPDSIYGRSAVEICMKTIQMLIYGIDSNLEYYTDNSIAKGVFIAEGASQDDTTQISTKLTEKLRAKNDVGDFHRNFYKMPVIGFKGDFVRTGFSNLELDQVAQQEWFSKVVWSTFGVTPSELGFTEDSNRATETNQSRVHKRRAIRPLIQLLEFHINSEIIPEFNNGVWLHKESPNEILIKGIDDVKFEFQVEDVSMRRELQELYQMEVKSGIRTVNEIRDELGLEPKEGGDEIRMQREPFGSPFGNDTASSVEEGAEKRGQDLSQGKKAFDTSSPAVIGEFEEISFKPFEKPLKRILVDMERMVKESLTRFNPTGEFIKNLKSDRVEITKAIDQDIIRNIKNSITIGITDEILEKEIRDVYFKALDKVANEINANFTLNNRTISFLADFALENVKDLGESVKADIRKQLELGVMAGEGIVKLKKRITAVFDKAENRAEAIARTETNRADNAGRNEAYEQSGLKGKIEWVAQLDSRTSEICRHLNGDKRTNSEVFRYKEWQGKAPPSHPNCRSRIVFIPD